MKRSTPIRPPSPALAFLLLLAVALAALAQPGEAPDAAAAPPGAEPAADGAPPAPVPAPVLHVRLDSIIHVPAAEFVVEELEHADAVGAAALVLELNTPGGMLDATRDIFKAMLGARTPVIVYVGPSGAQAASAGFFILMAADVAAMAPGTNTGAAHPVGGQGEDIEGDMGAKVEQDAAATIRALARQHGRNVELAEAAVVESRSYAASEALENGLIEVVAPSIAALLREIDGRTVEKAGEEPLALRTAEATVERREMRRIQRFLAAIGHPQIALLLMSFGFLGLYVEITNPGFIVPGVVGAICLIVGFYALSVLPVNYAGMALILLALLLFVAEVFVVSYGVLTVGGAIAMILGVLILFRSPDPALRVDLKWILAVTGGMVLAVGLLMAKALQVQRGKVVSGAEGLIGETGTARTALAPRGKVFVHGELWNAWSEQPIDAGGAVEVVALEGLDLQVRPAGS